MTMIAVPYARPVLERLTASAAHLNFVTAATNFVYPDSESAALAVCLRVAVDQTCISINTMLAPSAEIVLRCLFWSDAFRGSRLFRLFLGELGALNRMVASTMVPLMAGSN